MKRVVCFIEVPDGKYCWKYSTEGSEICGSFNNEHNMPGCNFNFSGLYDNGEGIIKSPTCNNLSDEPVIGYLMRGK